MSEHDRGAYTPNNEAPLSFDARQSRGRRAFPTTLLISILILIGLAVAIFMFYRSGVRGAGEAPTPVGTPVGEIKSPPPAQAQPQDPGQGLQIYKAEGNAEAPASSTGFAPPPEQPQARPVAPVAAQPIAPAKPAPAQALAADPTAIPPAQVAQAAPAKPAPAPAPAAKPAPVPAAPVVAQAKPAPPPAKPVGRDDIGALLDSKSVAKPAAPAAKPAAPVVASASHGAAVVQFGAFSSSDLASSEWAKLAKAYPSEMSGKGRLVESVERDGKTLFRGAVSGFASRPDAVAFCARLKADGKACIVK